MNRISTTILSACGVLICGPLVSAQPWDIFDDAQSASTCDVINSADAELVVLSSGELVLVSGQDATLGDSRVDAEGDVFLGNDQFGLITFATDRDGFRTLWWTSFTGHVLDIDGITLEITETDLLPQDFENVPCGVCDAGLWDVAADCAEVIEPPVTIRICGNDVVVPMIMTFAGLLAFGFPLRRRYAGPTRRP